MGRLQGDAGETETGEDIRDVSAKNPRQSYAGSQQSRPQAEWQFSADAIFPSGPWMACVWAHQKGPSSPAFS
jgi:hypothetical protein